MNKKNHGHVIDYTKVELTEAMFYQLTRKMYELAGVNLPLTDKNFVLVQSRISKVLRKHEYENYEEYWEYLSTGYEGAISEFVSALTTNLTFFFRETPHFDFFSQILPKLPQKFGEDVRVWCAAASTGQEPYSIGIAIKEAHLPSRVRVLATDVDLEVLKKAAGGIYTEREFEGLSSGLRKKYFDPVKGSSNLWAVKNILSEFIRFAPFNLMEKKYDFRFDFHLIFCRNVLIYFDEKTQKKVIGNIVDKLAIGGYLIVGHSESGNIKHPKLKALGGAIFQKIEK